MLEEGDLERILSDLAKEDFDLYCLWGELDSDLADGDLDLECLPDIDDNVVVLFSVVYPAKANMKIRLTFWAVGF